MPGVSNKITKERKHFIKNKKYCNLLLIIYITIRKYNITEKKKRYWDNREKVQILVSL